MNRTPPDLQRPQQTHCRTELQEVPVSNPAELAGYAADVDPRESGDELSFVDLGFAGEQAYAADGDEFGSFGADDDIDLDAA